MAVKVPGGGTVRVQWSLPADQIAIARDWNGVRGGGGSIPTREVDWNGRVWRVALHTEQPLSMPMKREPVHTLYACAHDPAEVARAEADLEALAVEWIRQGDAKAIETIEAKAVRLAVAAAMRAGMAGETVRTIVSRAIAEWGGFEDGADDASRR